MASDQPKADILMKFKLDGKYVYGEGAHQVDESIPVDDLMDGFESATYKSYSNFFEIQKFEFGIELHEDDTNVGKLSNGSLATNAHGQTHKPKPAKLRGAFASWRSASQAEIQKLKFPLEADMFSFTRVLDAASHVFFMACVTSRTFESVSLVKRVSATKAPGGPMKQLGFFRVDFNEVMITGLDWDDGDFVNENCKFICKKFKLQYKTQKPDGTLTRATQAAWEQSMNANDQRR